MTYLNGNEAEVLFSRLLKQHKSTFEKVDLSCFKEEDLVNLALSSFPSKVRKFLENNKFMLEDLYNFPIKELLDLFFKVDFLIEVDLCGDKPQWISIDLTTNPEKIRGKVYELNQNQKVLKTLGIDLSLVVYWTMETYSTQNKELSYRLATQLYEDIEKAWERGKFSSSSILAI